MAEDDSAESGLSRREILQQLDLLKRDESGLASFVSQLPIRWRDECDEWSETLVHDAARMPDGACVLRQLITHWGPECLKVQAGDGDTAVHLVAWRQQAESLSFIKETLGPDYAKLRGLANRTPVHSAAQNELSNSAFKWIVQDQGPDCLKVPDCEDTTPAHFSARYQNADSMQFIRDCLGHSFASMKALANRTPVHYAALNKKDSSALSWFVQNESVKCLVVKDKENTMPVHFSARYQDAEVNRLIRQKIGSSYLLLRGLCNRTCAHYAAQNEKSNEILQQIVEAEGEQCLFESGDDETLPIHFSAIHQDAEAMQFIKTVVGSKYTELKGLSGRMPVHYAAMNQRANSTLKWMVKTEGKSCLLLKDSKGLTACHFSAEYQGADSMQFIKETLGPSFLEVKSDTGRTPAHSAALNENSNEALKWIVENEGVEFLTARDNDNDTVVHFSAMYQSADSMEFIKDKMGDEFLNTRGLANRTAVHYAASNRVTNSAFKWIVENEGSDCLWLEDDDSDTPVHFCVRYQGVDSIKFVKKMIGSEYLKMRGLANRTPLHYAAQNKKTNEVLKWIVTAEGPDCLKEKDVQNSTIVHFCARYQGPDSMSFIRTQLGPEYLDLKGIANRSPVHYAALNDKSSDTLRWIVETEGSDSLIREDDNQSTPVHVSAEYQDADTMSFIKENLGDRYLELKNSEKRTPVHSAAQNEKTSETLEWIIRTEDGRHLTAGDEKNVTPVHFCAEYLRSEPMKAIRGKLGSSFYKLKGVANRTVAHYAALNANSHETLRWIVQSEGVDCLMERDDYGYTPAHYAVKFGNKMTVNFIAEALSLGIAVSPNEELLAKFMARPDLKRRIKLPEQSRQLMLDRAADGTNFLHVICYNRTLGPFVFQSVLLGLKMSEEDAMKQVDARGRSPLFHACLGKNYEVAEHFASQFCDSRDNDGNSLLHAVFQNLKDSWFSWQSDAEEALKFVSCLKSLVEAGVELSAENTSSHTCLQSSELPEKILYFTFKALQDAFSRTQIQQLLINSEGMHTVHVYAGRYDLDSRLLSVIAELSDVTADYLLRLRVSGGLYKGATCLHLACEAARSHSIRFLMSRNLHLNMQTEAGESCIDFAIKKGKLEDVESVVRDLGVKDEELLRLIDPANRALRLPDRRTARSLLDSFVDRGVRTNVEKDIDDRGGRDATNSADMQLLFRAVQQDSSEMLRSLLVLGFAKEIGKVDLKEMLERKKTALHETESKSTAEAEDFRSVTVTDFAFRHEKVNVLSDVCLTSQFDLIPVCLVLLIRIGAKVRRKKGKQEQLTSLQSSVFCILLNALDSLFTNGDQQHQQLVFRYLTADFDEGPRFQCRLIDKPADSAKDNDESQYSLLQLIDMLNSKDLFSTDCMNKFVETLWSSPAQNPFRRGKLLPSQSESSKFSYKAKFIVHFAAFIVFLIFFAWFVTDFDRSFSSMAPLIIMFFYALAFTAQELNELVFRFNMVFTSDTTTSRIPKYFTEFFNYFDIAALLLMWIGLIWRSLLHLNSATSTQYSCQMVLAASFLIWGIRSIELFSFFKFIGPLISMLKGLLINDLGSFLIILFVIFYSFSVFFFNLMYPATAGQSLSSMRDFGQVVKEIWTLPLLLAFGIFERGDLKACNDSDVYETWSECPDQTGFKAFDTVFVYVFLLLVNIVMWNLLIALFSQTVATKQSRSVVIWRKKRYEMLRECDNLSLLPPPLSVMEYLVRLFSSWLRSNKAGDKGNSWWQSENLDDYPKDFKSFLRYQAKQLREYRPRLTQRIEKHKSDFESSKAHTENVVANMARQMEAKQREELADVTEKLESQLSAQDKELMEIRSQMSILQSQSNEILQLLSRLERTGRE